MNVTKSVIVVTSLVLITAGTTRAQTFTSADTPLGIPIGAPGATSGFTTSTITVGPNVGIISDANIRIDADHTFVGDLDIDITSPAGAVVRLSDSLGGATDLDGSYVFDDQAGTPWIGPGNPVASGSYSPQNPLAAFNGQVAAGDWTLTILDNIGGDSGTLDLWQLILSAADPNIIQADLHSVA